MSGTHQYKPAPWLATLQFPFLPQVCDLLILSGQNVLRLPAVLVAAVSPYLAGLLADHIGHEDIHLIIPAYCHHSLSALYHLITMGGTFSLSPKHKIELIDIFKLLGFGWTRRKRPDKPVVEDSDKGEEEVSTTCEDKKQEQIGSDIIDRSDVNTIVKKECLTEMGIKLEKNDDETSQLEVCHSIENKGDISDNETEYIGNLNNHKRINSREKIYIESELSERPFECNLCEYKAKTKGNLTSHQIGHSKERPYVCELCDYKAKHRSLLKAHSKIHTDSRPFHCDQCEYKARERSAMIVHMRVHTGDRPFECEKCEYKAKDGGTLSSHKRRHNDDDEKTYKCDLCKYKGKKSCDLKRHRIKYHM